MLPPRYLDTGAGESTGAALARATRRGRRCSLVRLLSPPVSRYRGGGEHQSGASESHSQGKALLPCATVVAPGI